MSEFHPLHFEDDTRVDEDIVANWLTMGSRRQVSMGHTDIGGVLKVKILHASAFHRVLMNHTGTVNRDGQPADSFSKTEASIVQKRYCSRKMSRSVFVHA